MIVHATFINSQNFYATEHSYEFFYYYYYFTCEILITYFDTKFNFHCLQTWTEKYRYEISMEYVWNEVIFQRSLLVTMLYFQLLALSGLSLVLKYFIIISTVRITYFINWNSFKNNLIFILNSKTAIKGNSHYMHYNTSKHCVSLWKPVYIYRDALKTELQRNWTFS
jgi:hypothetical protein